jgi:hypothetical protein
MGCGEGSTGIEGGVLGKTRERICPPLRRPRRRDADRRDTTHQR